MKSTMIWFGLSVWCGLEIPTMRMMRRRKHEICLESGKPLEAEHVAAEYTDVYETMMGLPEKYRVILYLYYYEGYSLKEIAALLKTNASTLRSRFAKAKELMKEYLQDD